MPSSHTSLRTLCFALGLTSSSVLAAQEGLTLWDFANRPGGASFGLTATPDIRRGTTTTLRIVRNFIDLSGAPFALGAGPVLSSISRGKTGGIGFIQMNVFVPEDRGIGTIVEIVVPAQDPSAPIIQTFFHVKLKVVHLGQINSVVFVPNPKDIASGQPFEVTVNGDDLGSVPGITQLSCHTIAIVARVNSSFRQRLTKDPICSSANLGPFSFTILSSGPDDPNSYATSQGTTTFQFGPYQGCVAEPNLGPPVVIAPQHNSVFLSAPLAPRIVPIVFRWNRVTSNNLSAPKNEWLVSLPERDLTDGEGTVILPPQVKTITDTVTTESFRRPGAYYVSIRGKNCGSGSGTTTVRFELR